MSIHKCVIMTSVIDEKHGITMVIFLIYTQEDFITAVVIDHENSQVKCILMVLSSYTVNDRGLKFSKSTKESVGG